MSEWLRQNPSRLAVEPEAPVCSSPSSLTGIHLASLSRVQMPCISGTRPLTAAPTLSMAGNPLKSKTNTAAFTQEGLEVKCIIPDTNYADKRSVHDMEENECCVSSHLRSSLLPCFILLFIAKLPACNNTESPCPETCSCENGSVNCSDKNLAEIPENLPPNTVKL
ncbi:unnamed protein product [Protopolystoma xenopodis]|uniref:LRRNT domain-containing protein n=1 Tax=Protopolystoma xenopodis TaxID=117903 RepID=A0A3S5CL47_9PLAT|nr:unnamed protein product [Protopolystoma xenopodis]